MFELGCANYTHSLFLVLLHCSYDEEPPVKYVGCYWIYTVDANKLFLAVHSHIEAEIHGLVEAMNVITAQVLWYAGNYFSDF